MQAQQFAEVVSAERWLFNLRSLKNPAVHRLASHARQHRAQVIERELRESHNGDGK